MKKIIVISMTLSKQEKQSEGKSELEKIMSKTGRDITECQCDKCRSQCKTPCLGTPDDILKLLKAGYINELVITDWMFGKVIGEIPYPIRMVQAGRTKNGCVFFKDGLCTLHDKGLKPTEGKLSNHTIKRENFEFNNSVTWNVAKEWINTKNIPVIATIFRIMKELGS